jgi:adenine-specific DNA-methyltransferase
LDTSGSIFVQIGEENLHRVRLLLDEIFGAKNSIATIYVQKSGGLGSSLLTILTDYLLWYSKDREHVKYRSQGYRRNTTVDYEFEGRTFHPGQNACWKTTPLGLDRLAAKRVLR